MQSIPSLIADPGVMSLIPAWPHTLMEINHGHSPPSTDSRRAVNCQLYVKVCAQSTGLLLSLSLPGKIVVRLTNCLNMIIAVDWDVKPLTKHDHNALCK